MNVIFSAIVSACFKAKIYA